MKRWLRLLILAGILAQAAVPAWMLWKRHCILTRGDVYRIAVTIYDPRDLFMGCYVQLSPLRQLPQPLQEIRRRPFLRFYCDHRYAARLEQTVATLPAELVVRHWRGSALAEQLLINGKPAYEAVNEQAPLRQESVWWRIEIPTGVLPAQAAQTLYSFRNWQSGDRLLFSPRTNLLWAAVAHTLQGAQEPLPVPRAAADAYFDRLEQYRYSFSGTLVLPIFTGLPFPCSGSFEEQAAACYAILRKLIHWRATPMFYGDPGEMPAETVLAAARKAFPDCIWFVDTIPDALRGDDGVRLRPETVHTVGLFRSAPEENAAAYVARLKASPDLAQKQTFLTALVDAAVREAGPDADAEALDMLLQCADERSARTWFDRCTSLEEYRALMHALYEAGIRLGGVRGDDVPVLTVPRPVTDAFLLECLDRLGLTAADAAAPL